MELSQRIGKLSKIWWLPLITGLLSIGLGVWTLCEPSESLTVFAYAFAAIMLVAGIAQLLHCRFLARLGAPWGWTLVLAILDIIAAVWLFTLPASLLATTFVYIIALWMLVVAINSVVEACAMTSSSPIALTLMILLLIVTISCAIVFLSNPVISGITAWLWLGLSLLTFGIYRLILAYKIKTITDFKFRP